MLDHQSPLGDGERASIAVRDHFLIQWQLNWRIVGLLCKTMSCFWIECFALNSGDALEASSRVDMLTTCLVILLLFSTYFPASQSSKGKRGQWEGWGEIKAFHLFAPYGSPVAPRSAWQHALSRTHKVPASDTLTPELGTRSPVSAEQTLYSARWRKHNCIGPAAYN